MEGPDKTWKCGQGSETRREQFPYMGIMCTGYEKNGDGVATEEVSDGRSVEKDGSHSETPVLEKVDLRGWLGRVLGPKMECTVVGLRTNYRYCQTIKWYVDSTTT